MQWCSFLISKFAKFWHATSLPVFAHEVCGSVGRPGSCDITSITRKGRPRGPAERHTPYVIVYNVYRYSLLSFIHIYIYTYSYIYTIYKHVIWLVVYESKVFASFWVELSLHLMYINPQSRGWWYGGPVLDRCAGGWEWPCAFYLRLQASHALRLSGRWSCHAGLWDAPFWMGWNLNDMTFVCFQWDLADLSMLWFRNPKAYIMWNMMDTWISMEWHVSTKPPSFGSTPTVRGKVIQTSD